jgi:hypothetical protein
VGGLITGADYNAFTNEIVLIGYSSNKTYSFIYYLYDFPQIRFFSGNKRRVQIGSSLVWQTEGIAWHNEMNVSRFFISCESAGTYSASVYSSSKNNIPAGINQLAPNAGELKFEYSVNGEVIIISSLEIKEVKVFDLLGRNVDVRVTEEQNAHRLTINLPVQLHLAIISVQVEDGKTVSKKILR